MPKICFQGANSYKFTYFFIWRKSNKYGNSSLDKDNNVIKVLVYRTINNGFICPNCGENIKIDLEKIDDIILSNNNIKDTIEGIKLNMETIIKISSNIINIQLKNINILLGNIIEDIKKNNEKLKNLLNDSNTIINKALINNNDFHNKNLISGVLDIKINEINNKVILFETDIKEGIDVYLNNQKINMIKEGNNPKLIISLKMMENIIFKLLLMLI